MLVLDLATSEGYKAELTWVVVTSQDSLPQTVTYLRDNQALAVSWSGVQPDVSK